MTSEGLNESRIKEELERLKGRYNGLKKKRGEKGLSEISEADVRADFIDELFRILGWDTKNPEEYNREKYVRGAGLADIALTLDGETVCFVEAKRFQSIPAVNRKEKDWIEQERQVMNYAMVQGIKWAVLTNFEKLRVFNALNGNLIFSIEAPYEYTDKIKQLLLLRKASFERGDIEKFSEHTEKPDIDLGFLEKLNRWRKMLANSIYRLNRENEALLDGGEFSMERLMSAVQRLLDRMIIVRYAEDRLILDNPDQLMKLKEAWEGTKAYLSLYDDNINNYFRGFDRVHDSQIFESGHICERVKMDDDVLAEIIDDLYSVNFRKFDFDILGNTYETYLGNRLAIDEKGEVVLRPVQQTRKKSGIYYTPPYVVDYIVKNTLGEALKGKTPEEVKKLRVLDPSCGSGSFLIKAYDYFARFYEEENRRMEEKKREMVAKLRKNGNGLEDYATEGVKKYDGYEKKILKENIYGVDLDAHAAEIAAVNLVLKALRPEEKLPLILGEHIRVGNSLISGDEETLKKYFGDNWKEKWPFNWEEEFREAFDEGGFDVIIGNPPYIRVQNLPAEERKFFSTNYRSALGSYDIYVLFVEKAIKLLRDGGRFSFIMPLKFFQANYGKKLRKLILENCNIDLIVDFGTTKVFGDATTYPCLLFLTKTKKRKKTLKYVRIKRQASDLAEIAEKKLDKKSILKESYEIFDATQDLLTEETWNFLKKEKENIFRKMRKIERKLGDIAPRIFQGLVTGADPIYFVKILKETSAEEVRIINNLGKEYTIEKAVLRPILKGEGIRRWGIAWEGYFIIYPYEIKNAHADLYAVERLKKDFPHTWNYFLANEDYLKNRENGTWKNRPDWYAYGRRQNIEMFEQIKIMTGVLSKRASFTLDEEGKYYFVGGGNAGGYGIILNEEFGNSPEKYRFVLSLLNSRLLDFYLHSISTRFQSDYYSYARRFIERLPIAEATESEQKELASLADRMLSLHKQLNSIDVNFEHYVNRRPRVKDARLKEYLDMERITTMRDGKGRETNRITCDRNQCRVTAVDVEEKAEELIFSVTLEEKGKKGETAARRIPVFSAKIESEAMRGFIYHSFKAFVRPSHVGNGGIYDRLLKLRIPRFEVNKSKNSEIIHEIMAEYLPRLEEWRRIKGEIDETDALIDRKVYALYGLTDEEIEIIEDTFGDD